MGSSEDIEARLTRLEHRLSEIESRLGRADADVSGQTDTQAGLKRDQSPSRGKKRRWNIKPWRSEDWLQRLGIGLLLFGLAFLFKYSIDQGWLTPMVRLGIGFLGGISLVAGAMSLAGARQGFAHTLAGGGIGALYISFFAAFQLYHLLSFATAFTGMCAVTLAAFGLSLRGFGAPIAFIAALGGYATPFVLYTGSENLPGLLSYGALISLAGSAVYLRHSWRSLLAVTVIGGWLMIIAGYTSAGFRAGIPAAGTAPILQYGVVCFWGIFALLPMVSLKVRQDLDKTLLGLVVATPTLGMVFSEHLWHLTDMQWSGTWFAVAMLYAVPAYVLRRSSGPMAWAHGMTMAMIFTVGLWHTVSEDMLLLTVAMEALALLELSRRFDARIPGKVAHAILATVLYVVLIRLTRDGTGTPAMVNPRALTDLVVIGIVAFVAWRYARSSRDAYAVAAHLGLLGWFYRELYPLENGQVFVSIAWGLYGAGLLILSFRCGHDGLRKLSMATLLLVVIKLFVVDLARIAAVWRVMASLGLGSMFLLLGYYLPHIWRARGGGDAGTTKNPR